MAGPLLLQKHVAHAAVVAWWGGRKLALSGHALAETYSVLARLPGDLRLASADAARLLATRFEPPLLLGGETTAHLPEVLSGRGIVGGAVYDALVGLAATEHGADLATRDGRARRRRTTPGRAGGRRAVKAVARLVRPYCHRPSWPIGADPPAASIMGFVHVLRHFSCTNPMIDERGVARPRSARR